MNAACTRSGRDPGSVRLVAVTKTVPAEIVGILNQCGVEDFGENRLPQAVQKIAEVSSPVRWHMIGHLQRNKVRYAVSSFDLIHSIDSMRIAEEVAARSAAKGIDQDVLVQVNVSCETTKGGFSPHELVDSFRQCRKLSNFRVRGLMSMAPFVEDPETVRPVFRRLRELRDELAAGFPDSGPLLLSMGMTQDFEQAIEEGADLIRVGTALFRGL